MSWVKVEHDNYVDACSYCKALLKSGVRYQRAGFDGVIDVVACEECFNTKTLPHEREQLVLTCKECGFEERLCYCGEAGKRRKALADMRERARWEESTFERWWVNYRAAHPGDKYPEDAPKEVRQAFMAALVLLRERRDGK